MRATDIQLCRQNQIRTGARRCFQGNNCESQGENEVETETAIPQGPVR